VGRSRGRAESIPVYRYIWARKSDGICHYFVKFAIFRRL